MDYALNTLGLDPSFQIDFYTGIDASGNPIGYIPNFNSYTNISTPDQVIYMTISNTNTDSNGDLCTTVRPITLHVDLLPNVLEILRLERCDDDYFDEMDGIYPFDLEAEIFVITGGVTGLGITFHETYGDAENNINPIPNPSAYENTLAPGGDDVFARVYDESTGCYAITHIKLHVDANPTPLSNQIIIDQLGNNGVMEECDGNVDGSGSIAEQVAEFDLTLWETLILTGENGPGVETGVSASYYTSYDDADGGTNAIPNTGAYTNTSNPQTIYVRVTNDGTGIVPQTAGTGCYTIVQFDIYVPVPELNIEVSSVLCVDENGVPLSGAQLPVLSVTPSTGGYDYQWSYNNVAIPGATNATYTATEAGVYTVSVSGPTDFDCVNYASILVEESGMPDGFDANVTTTAFADNHQIQATATSNIPGIEFYYTLDVDPNTGEGVETNMTGLFTDVAPGLHYITITDGKGCWSEVVEVLVIDYPHFFTPNGDGVNDTWQIIGIEGIPISIIYIFDRYGKLLKQLDPDGAGWDGTYNGHMMPAGDYWFAIQYIEGEITPTEKEFKAHFSIKR
jgi:gliding motility-associated-like protein